MRRWIRWSVLGGLGLVGLMVWGLMPQEAQAHRSGCFPLRGNFEASPDPDCMSPVGFCTMGELSGSLRGTYRFSMDGAAPSPGTPGINTFFGTSVVTTRRGATWTGIDDGVIDLDPDRFGAISSLITFNEGTGYLERATGQIRIIGSVNFETGGSSGRYIGQVCYE